MKNKNGRAYIYVVIILMIASLILSSTLCIVNISREKKYDENNNLYYMAQSGTDKFLDMINKILALSTKQSEESEMPKTKIFHENIKKYLSMPTINLEIKNAPKNYNVQINFEQTGDFVFKVKSCATDLYSNNKIEIDCEYEISGEKFHPVSYKMCEWKLTFSFEKEKQA